MYLSRNETRPILTLYAPMGFYRGVVPAMVGAGLVNAAAFGGYGSFQSIVRRVTIKCECIVRNFFSLRYVPLA